MNSGQSNTVEEDVSWIGMIEPQEDEEQNQNLNTLVKEEDGTPKTVVPPKKRCLELYGTEGQGRILVVIFRAGIPKKEEKMNCIC